MSFAGFVEKTSTKRSSVSLPLPWPSEKPIIPRVSIPTCPPGVVSRSVPAIFTAKEVVYSSVASVESRPSARPSHSASWWPGGLRPMPMWYFAPSGLA